MNPSSSTKWCGLRYNEAVIKPYHYGTGYEAAQAAGAALVRALEEFRTCPVLLMSSGGSAMGLVDVIPAELLDQRVTVTVLDERFSRSPAENNFALLSKTAFYAKAVSAGCAFIDTRVQPDDTLALHAERFEEALRHWHRNNPSGVIIATFGIGRDGHISGIMPYPERSDFFYAAFVNTSRWVVSYDAAAKNPYPLRTTTTFPFLKLIARAIVFAAGADKQEALLRTLAPSGSLAGTPARFLAKLPSVELFTDCSV